MASPTVDGLVSGLNTTQIIQGLLSVNQQQVTDLQNTQQTETQQETAFSGIEAQLLTLQSAASALAPTSAASNVFNVKNVTSSNTNLVTAAASSGATPGIYTLKVNNLAQANEIASQGFDSATSAIAKGTLQIQAGTGSATTITIDSTNDTLQGLASAINNSGAGVTASVVNDGSGVHPYRLLLASDNTGTDNAITITNSLTDTSNGGVTPEFNSNYIGTAVTGAGWTGTAAPSANSGAGNYTGTSNDVYTFTVKSISNNTNTGTVGTDDIQISYSDSTGAIPPGSFTVGSGDLNNPITVAQGIQVSFGSGTLVAGQTFSVAATVPTVQQAANASITLGSGAGALTVQSDSNQVENAINGVTINLLAADPTQQVTLTVGNDPSNATSAVNSFVQAYNTVIQTIDQDTSYDASTKTAGPLLGQFDANDIESQIRNAVTGVIPGLNPNMNTISDLGITTNQQGQLTVDSTTLANVLNGQVSGVSLNDVSNLFARVGTSSNPNIQYVTTGSKTVANGTPYQVTVTQAATQASITASTPLAATLPTIDSSNNTFTISVDGQTSGTITITPGSNYTATTLAQEVQKEINANTTLQGRQVTASVDSNNNLVITSGSYGSKSQVAIGSGTALGVLGFNGTETNQGQDVAGKFTVNGVDESATGSGQLLTGNAGNANTDGLELLVSLTPAQIQSGPQATVTVTDGIAASLGSILNGLTDPVTGRLQTIDNNYQTQIQAIQQSITTQNNLIAQKQQALLTEFTNMEETLAKLQQTGNFLSAQLNAASLFNGQSATLNTPSASSLNLGSGASNASSSSGSSSSGSSSGSGTSSGS